MKLKPKKIPYYLALFLLTSGASLIIGFLSFGGMFAIWPVLPIAFASFGLSVAYEGEIYLQNIKGALNKLFKLNYDKNLLASEYLEKNFPDDTKDTKEIKCPQFFRDLEAQLKIVHQLGHHQHDKASKKRAKQAKKTLKDMHKWFAKQLFAEVSNETSSDYEKELRNWLVAEKRKDEQVICRRKLEKRAANIIAVKTFSTLAGLFMGLGTTYLLMETFASIPMLAAISMTTLPFVIVPMAMIAGAAYGFLTYNAITDMINNDTLRTWYHKIRGDLGAGFTLHNVFMALTTTVLVLLALALTVCTAGTWWTVAKEAKPLFAWMGKMPSYIMGVINPIVTGLSAVVFNLQNSSETLEMIQGKDKAKEEVSKPVQNNENWRQKINPFRLLLKITIMPLRILLFLGHLISIGVTADRVPGMPQILSALLGIISEGFEDAHYFMGDEHGHGEHSHETKSLIKEHLSSNKGHNHDVDLPTRILKLVFSPIYALATLWDWGTSKRNSESNTLSLSEAWNKQTGVKKQTPAHAHHHAPQPSDKWQVEQTVFRIEHYKEKHLKPTQDEFYQLTQLQKNFRKDDFKKDLTTRLMDARGTCGYMPAFFSTAPAETLSFLDELPERVINSIN